MMEIRFGGPVSDIAEYMVANAGPRDDLIPLLPEIERRWPELSFTQFVNALALAGQIALQPMGRA